MPTSETRKPYPCEWQLMTQTDSLSRKIAEKEEIGGRMMTHEQIVDLLWRYKRALEGLTAGGSEFVNDPEYCAKCVRERQQLGVK